MKKVVMVLPEQEKLVALDDISKNKIYAAVGSSGTMYKAHILEDRKCAFISLDDSHYYMGGTAASLCALIADDISLVYEFDNQIEFLEWALDQVKGI